MGLSKQKAKECFLFIKWNGNYCSTQMIAAALVHPAVPLAKIASDVVSLYIAIAKLPVPVQFEQSFALLVKFVFKAGKVVAVTNILHGPVVEQGPTVVLVDTVETAVLMLISN